MPIYAFTNSNRTHQIAWAKRFSETLSLFDALFISSEIGKRKPEPAAFQIVAESIGLEFHQMLFFDDSIENIIGARKLGLNTVHVKSAADVEEYIKAKDVTKRRMYLETLRELFPKLGPKYIVDADQKNFLPFLNMSNPIGNQK